MPLPTPAAVIFDMDGVLLDSEPLHFDTIRTVLGSDDVNFTEEMNREYLGWSFRPFFAAMATRFDLPRTEDEYLARYQLQILPALETAVEQEGVTLLVRALAERGVALAVASSSPRRWIEVVLAALGLSDFFPVVVAGEDVVNGKPHPDIYLLAASQLQVAPTECVAIEDSPAGARAAHSAGMRVIGVRTPMVPEGQLVSATLVVDSLAPGAGAWPFLGLDGLATHG